MDESKLKKAFSKIKKEIEKINLDNSIIRDRLDRQERAGKLSEEVKKDIERLKESNFSGISKKIENEINNLNGTIKKLNEKHSQFTSILKDLTNQMEIYKRELDRLRENNGISSEDIKILKGLREQTIEFEQMLDDKVSLETGSLRLEMESGLASLASDMNKLSKNIEEIKTQKQEIPKKVLEEFAEMVNERISLEISGLKMEMYEEIALRNQRKREKISNEDEEEYESDNTKKESRVKKAVKWLFVDEDEEDMNTIKEEIKEKKKTKKVKTKK